MKFLGIDYGKTKIGLAQSDGELASPWQVLQISGLEDALKKINQIIQKENVQKIIIGCAESGESLKITLKFIKSLEKLVSIEIIQVSETLSTQNARSQMIEMGVAKSKRGVDDSYSAAIILQDFLDGQNLA